MYELSIINFLLLWAVVSWSKVLVFKGHTLVKFSFKIYGLLLSLGIKFRVNNHRLLIYFQKRDFKFTHLFTLLALALKRVFLSQRDLLHLIQLPHERVLMLIISLGPLLGEQSLGLSCWVEAKRVNLFPLLSKFIQTFEFSQRVFGQFIYFLLLNFDLILEVLVVTNCTEHFFADQFLIFLAFLGL